MIKILGADIAESVDLKAIGAMSAGVR